MAEEFIGKLLYLIEEVKEFFGMYIELYVIIKVGISIILLSFSAALGNLIVDEIRYEKRGLIIILELSIYFLISLILNYVLWNQF